MDFVFFDIECASVFKTVAKICAFGYVVTDENFIVKEKRDILINPQGAFHLMDHSGEKGLVLPYDYKEFKKHPPFPKVYREIKKLLTGGALVFGHSVMNDVKYLNLECKRFSLPPLEFSFYDTQFLYMNKTHSYNQQVALSTIAGELGVEFVAHKAVDDAYATAKIAEAICKEEGKSMVELLAFYGVRAGYTKNGEAKECTSLSKELFNREKSEQKMERERERSAFVSAVNKKHKKPEFSFWKGERFLFSKSLEREQRAIEYVEEVYRRGGTVCFRVEKATCYVESEADNSPRRKRAEEKGISILSEEDFKEMIR